MIETADGRRCDEGGREAAAPVPVRYWWAKRIAVGALVWLVVMGAVRWGWGCEADRRLNAEIAKYQAAGEPIYPEDFNSAFVPDEENGAKVYLAARDAMGEMTWQELDLLFSLQDGSEGNPDKLGVLIQKQAPALALARRAREMSHYDWGIELDVLRIVDQLPDFVGTRGVIRLVCGAGWAASC